MSALRGGFIPLVIHSDNRTGTRIFLGADAEAGDEIGPITDLTVSTSVFGFVSAAFSVVGVRLGDNPRKAKPAPSKADTQPAGNAFFEELLEWTARHPGRSASFERVVDRDQCVIRMSANRGETSVEIATCCACAGTAIASAVGFLEAAEHKAVPQSPSYRGDSTVPQNNRGGES